ncbi:MAG: sensor domain-containing diguanylate cyclase [Motiliproteus sp.]|nr:sensor domain-containing diguanylate cyclase [Motiliproteus sp.]MCW9053152.1 sensor domain-containing diguanylate cyclase [Motiliproteus sp.]
MDIKKEYSDVIMFESYGDQLASICPDPIIAVNRTGTITLFNPAAEKLLGYSAKEVVGIVNITDLYHPASAGREIKRLIHTVDQGGKGQIQGHESALKTKAGTVIPIQISATLLLEDSDEVGSVGFFHDLTPRKNMEHTLKQQSITDSLSGLYNQRHFQSTLIKEIARGNRYQHPLTLMCLDMDNFKSVNDQLGHIVGDSLISFMGRIIRDQLRECDYGFRYGGDEFMIVLPEACEDNAQVVAERLLQNFSDDSPLNHIGPSPAVSISIGIAELEEEEGPEDLFKRADMAMYLAKRNGGNQSVKSKNTEDSAANDQAKEPRR